MNGMVPSIYSGNSPLLYIKSGFLSISDFTFYIGALRFQGRRNGCVAASELLHEHIDVMELLCHAIIPLNDYFRKHGVLLQLFAELRRERTIGEQDPSGHLVQSGRTGSFK